MKRMVIAGGLVALLLSGCSIEGAVGTPSTMSPEISTPSATETQASASFVADEIPVDPTHGADDGCLDEAGSLVGRAADWYPESDGGSMNLSGDRSTSESIRNFATALSGVADDLVPDFAFDGESELLGRAGCATHRLVVFTRGEESVVVGAWRLTSAANPYWVPNEAPFRRVDDSTLASDGEHIKVVLVVGPDGTTGEAVAYGANAGSLVAGWPSTAPLGPDAPAALATTVSTEVLTELARAALSTTIDARAGA